MAATTRHWKAPATSGSAFSAKKAPAERAAFREVPPGSTRRSSARASRRPIRPMADVEVCWHFADQCAKEAFGNHGPGTILKLNTLRRIPKTLGAHSLGARLHIGTRYFRGPCFGREGEGTARARRGANPLSISTGARRNQDWPVCRNPGRRRGRDRDDFLTGRSRPIFFGTKGDNVGNLGRPRA